MNNVFRKRRVGTFRKTISVLIIILLLCPALIACSKKAPDIDTQPSEEDITSELPLTASGEIEKAPDIDTQPSEEDITSELPLTASGEIDLQMVLEQSAAVVYLAINPELALYVDANNIVIYSVCLNDDAREIYSGISFTGTSIEDCIRIVIETTIEQEYLTEDKEVKVDIAILDENANGDAIREKTQETINFTATQHDITVNVVATELEENRKIICSECLGTGNCIYCDTCGPCEFCFGAGEIFCDACEEGYIICFKCGGNTESEQFITDFVTMEVEYCKDCGYKVENEFIFCPVCNGTGKAPCHMCHGVGRTFCTKCNGKGYRISDKTKEEVACDLCNGTALKHCNECDGTGYEDCRIYCPHSTDRREFKTETVEMQIDNPNWCPDCQGQGRFLCNVCNGNNYIGSCPICDATGITPCGMCTQGGAHQKGVCSLCFGTGLIDP